MKVRENASPVIARLFRAFENCRTIILSLLHEHLLMPYWNVSCLAQQLPHFRCATEDRQNRVGNYTVFSLHGNHSITACRLDAIMDGKKKRRGWRVSGDDCELRNLLFPLQNVSATFAAETLWSGNHKLDSPRSHSPSCRLWSWRDSTGGSRRYTSNRVGYARPADKYLGWLNGTPSWSGCLWLPAFAFVAGSTCTGDYIDKAPIGHCSVLSSRQ